MPAIAITERRHGAGFAAPAASGVALANIAGWPRQDASRPQEVRFSPGRSLFFAGDEASCFYEIVTGTVRCCRLTHDGRRQIYRFAGAGELLGLGGDEIHSFSAEAVTEVVAYRHRLASLDSAMAADRRLRGRVLESLRAELSAVRLQMLLLGRMSAAERVASFLTEFSRRYADAEGWVRLPMTRTDIADYLGLTIETVSRKINEFKRLKLIELTSPGEFRIRDLDRVEEVMEAA